MTSSDALAAALSHLSATQRRFHIHLISDSTGETVSSVCRAALAQFENIEPDEHIWSLVRTPNQMKKVLAGISENPGVVLYTLVDKELRDILKQHCHQHTLPCIPILSRVISELTAYLGIQTISQPGKQHELNDDYFSRVEAINYALAHDDGQATWELEEADMVVVGVSRTSKSPTCVYLAYRGFKAANVPFVSGVPLPDGLAELKRPLVVGLTIDPDRLLQIRHTRLQSLTGKGETNYVDIEQIRDEVKESRKIYARYHWPVIDVTRRSVEETAATIIQYYQKHYEKRVLHGSQNG
ncbi:MAG: kinase/pyrophosphorylase [Rickettsiales bacterium]|nr:kinase/pyrophosphorylase [Rickettsiales bacterium]